MFTYEKDDAILEKLSYVSRGNCPNFFITGKSVSAIEQLGIRIVEALEEREAIRFRGICRHFTILMPFCASRYEEEQFMLHLRDSISIARECYDTFCGFVLLELSEQWARNVQEGHMELLLDFIRSERSIRFVLLCPDSDHGSGKDSDIDSDMGSDTGGDMGSGLDELYAKFAGSGPCVRETAAIPALQQCVSTFRKDAEKLGLAVSDEVSEYLKHRLRGRSELKQTNMEIVEGLLEHLTFRREFEQSDLKSIEIDDIRQYLPEHAGYKEPERMRIGF